MVALYESMNQPLVNIPNHGTGPTASYVLGTRNEHGHYTVFVYLYQRETKGVMIYVSEPRSLSFDHYRSEEAEAVRFAESMGFLIDNIGFQSLPVSEQDAVVSRVPVFRPVEQTFDLYEVADPEPAGPAAAVFGGLGQGAGEVFRQAGFSESPAAGGYGHAQGQGTSSLTGQIGPVPGQMSSQPGQLSSPPGPGSGAAATQPGLVGPPMGTGLGPHGSHPGQVVPGGGGSWPGQVAAMPEPLMPAGPGYGSSFDLYPSGRPGGPPGSRTGDFAGGGGGGSHAGAMAEPSRPSPAGTEPGPSSRAPAPDRGPMLERLGRLLVVFLALLVLWVPGCRTPQGRGQKPHTAERHLDLAMQQLAERRWPDAILSFGRVLEESPSDSAALRGTGFAYMSLGRMGEAESFYRRAVEADPKWSVAKNELAVVLIRRGQCQEAEALLLQVTEDIFYPTREFAEHNLARALACQGRSNEAVRRLDVLMVKRPHFCLGYLTLAQLSFEEKRHETTIQACQGFRLNCEEHEEIGPKVLPEQSAMCYLRKGLSYAEIGDLESARASFKRCQSDGKFGKECRRSLRLLPP